MEADMILQQYIKERKGKTVTLLPVLHKAKELYGTISVSVQEQIAKELSLPLSEVAAATTFYSAFNGMSDGEPQESFLELPESNGQVKWLLEHPKGYQAVKKMLAEQTDVIALLRDAKVCGKSGSGFPVANKWELTRDAAGDVKYIICNGSEGEGNTFKDMVLLTKAPHVIIEGMVLCALATDISEGFLYVRAEYEQAFGCVEQAIQEAYREGVLGENILGSGKTFHLEAVLGGGAYISGEETGLLQALEGLRSEPRLKPPYPGVCGLYGKPTIINNAESFAAAASLVLHGVQEFLRVGTGTAGGSKLFTVCGAVNRPGIYEVPHSITVKELLELSGGGKEGQTIKGFQLGGGATGSFGNREQFSTVLDYAGCRASHLALGTASIYFIGEAESVPKLSLTSIDFLKDQSCGMCTACRYGLDDLSKSLHVLCTGEGTAKTLENIESLCEYIGKTSRCAMGQAAPTAVTTALQAFRGEFEKLCRKEEISDEYGQM
jgi:NADH-quinone oxidoreductase subunit F